jgi:hypothetical protein
VLLRGWITRWLTRFLNQRIDRSERLHHNDTNLLKRHIRKGDVLLVEGDQRISAIIKYLTHSSWSHAALYIGDELVRRGGALSTLAVEHFGDESEHLVVEALTEGVVVSPLVKYDEHNVRVCRPHRLRGPHLRIILDEAVRATGWRYDMRNIFDLAYHSLAATLMPRRFRRHALQFGSGTSTEVICTSLIGRLFHSVGFPVLPSVSPPPDAEEAEEAQRSRWNPFRRWRARYSGVYRRRDPTLLTPRDFDLSPYFAIVKFNVVKQRGFDYGRIEWEETQQPAPTPDEPADGARPMLRLAKRTRQEPTPAHDRSRDQS